MIHKIRHLLPVFPVMLFVLSCGLLFAMPSFAEDDSEPPLLGPLNSDPLTMRGISPRVLDIALFPMAQDVYFELLMNYYVVRDNGDVGFERFRVIFDPYTDYGRDLFIEFEDDPLLSIKDYKRSLEVTMGKDHWVRKEDRLYDPKSLRVIKNTKEHEIIAFRFDNARVPSSLRWLTLLSGEVHIVDGRLDRIEFTADKTIERDGVRNRDYSTTVGFGVVEGHGGYVIDWMEEKFSFKGKGRRQHIHTWARMLKYRHDKFGEINWVQTPDEYFADRPHDASPVIASPGTTSPALQDDVLDEIAVTTQTRQQVTDDFDAAETVRLDLHRTLPIWADDVRKLGFELPKTYGLALIGLWQDAVIDLTDISVGGISVVDDIPLIDQLGSDFNSKITSVQFRGDAWILPFLNVSVIAGNLKTDTDVQLRFTPTFRTLYKLKTGEDLPEFVQFPASTTATTLGVGLMTGLQYENLIVSLSGNYANAVTNETQSEVSALVILGLVGYDFGDLGMQVLTGIQYQKTDQIIRGFLDTGNRAEPIEFSIGIDIEETMWLLGLNKDIGRNWNLTVMGGMNGTRTQFTAQFGYRW